MYTSAPALVPFLRSDAQARILAELLLRPERERTIAELAQVAGIAHQNATREVNRLVEAGLLRERRIGRTRLIAADTTGPYYGPLAQILARSYGPVRVIRDRLVDLPEVDRAVIAGSYAARYLGMTGPQPRDIDIIVIGTPPGRLVRRVGSELEAELGMPVQITVVPPEEWSAAQAGFVRDVQAKPLIDVPLEDRSREHPHLPS